MLHILGVDQVTKFFPGIYDAFSAGHTTNLDGILDFSGTFDTKLLMVDSWKQIKCVALADSLVTPNDIAESLP
jgi:hypothetical protein